MKTPERRHGCRSGIFLLTCNIFQTFSIVFIVDFEQVHVSWVI